MAVRPSPVIPGQPEELSPEPITADIAEQRATVPRRPETVLLMGSGPDLRPPRNDN